MYWSQDYHEGIKMLLICSKNILGQILKTSGFYKVVNFWTKNRLFRPFLVFFKIFGLWGLFVPPKNSKKIKIFPNFFFSCFKAVKILHFDGSNMLLRQKLFSLQKNQFWSFWVKIWKKVAFFSKKSHISKIAFFKFF